MKATVTHFNVGLGYYSAVTENQIKAVFTLLEPCEIRLDDILFGELESSGIRVVANESRGSRFKIEIKEIHRVNTPFRGHGGKTLKE